MHIPHGSDFGHSDFLDSKELAELGERLIHQKLAHLDDGNLLIDYRWKVKGGKSGGVAVLGKCVKLTGLARHLSLGSHFCIWLAADHCQDFHFGEREIEALLYHELCHIEVVEPEDPITYRTIGHDAELFFAELREYGAWKGDLRRLVETVEQLALPGILAQ